MATKKTDNLQDNTLPEEMAPSVPPPKPLTINEAILSFLGKQKPTEYTSLNDFLKILYVKEYNTRDFARELRNTLQQLASDSKIQVFGVHELDAPYWENVNGNGTPTKYKSASQVNVQARLL